MDSNNGSVQTEQRSLLIPKTSNSAAIFKLGENMIDKAFCQNLASNDSGWGPGSGEAALSYSVVNNDKVNYVTISDSRTGANSKS